MSVPVRLLTARTTTPAILPLAQTRSGNNKPKSLQKTKRVFKPNLTRADWPVTVLGGPVAHGEVLPKLKAVKMSVRRIRDVEKAGGIEGLLLSRRPKDLTSYGALLRSQLFEQLHQVKRDVELERRSTESFESLESGIHDEKLEQVETQKQPLLEGQ
ncbi:hypothetical protein L198_05513 [Cryptococcus wingfieldii CBS 7118]|uniref:Ribosomal protein L28 n=1 Tax=Cryptococcus wingfieldii CBS 7118 TaxID=1295528 RepID=A0A1E3IVU8_9TREE|nr:hypothetical protein L198_05513 [Cryptococcus wingfieldii CBS 7118]ODN92719.1 hypothetical protein L198_05513 [Cryptococcus wingfieldii CBS 7118]